MTNNKLLCCLIIGILFVLIIMIGNKVFKNKKIIEENFYDVENQDNLESQLTTIRNQLNAITTKNQEQDTALNQKQNKLTEDLESKLKLLEDIDSSDLNATNQNINLYKNALLEIDELRKNKDAQQLKSIKENEESVKNMKDSMIQISNTESNLDSIMAKLGEFHESYQANLETILEKRLSIKDAEFELKKENLNNLVSKLSDKIEKLEKQNFEEVINQIENVRTSTRLIVEKIPSSSNTYKIFVNTPENDAGCLSTNINSIPNGVICSTGSSNQQFIFDKINNETIYKEHIGKVSGKQSISLDKSIRYPFYLIRPVLTPLKCLVCNIDKSITKLSFKDPDGSMNERFDGYSQIDSDLSTCNM